MATLANIFDRLMAPRVAAVAAAPRIRPFLPDNPFAVRALANEDVYFFVKRIDNSRVVRAADPKARGACWKWIASSLTATALVVGLLFPNLYGLLAGYQIETLRQEQRRLQNESAALELEQARLLSPARLEELARMQQFIDPAPQRVVYLDAREGTLAKR